MSGEIQVQAFEKKYERQVGLMINYIQREEFGVPITLAEQPDLKHIPDFYQNKSGNFWVALDADEVVGSIGLIDFGEGQAAIRKMFVKADYRGKRRGVSAALYSQMLQWAAAQGIREIYLGTVSHLRAARRFYEKKGFCEIPKEELPESFPRMEVDTHFYRIQLSY